MPQWQAVLDKLLEIARRRVIVTVPYRENIVQSVCIHCGKLTPLYGHLHVFTEKTFPTRAGWRFTTDFILDYGKYTGGLTRRVWRMLNPYRSWLIAVYDRDASTPAG